MGGVWLRPEERPRRPRLSLERIVEAAVALLDAEGVDGFSMRRLAARLDAGTMSLYEYVKAKEDVLDLALDAGISEIEIAGEEDAGWREVLTDHMTRSRRVMLRHPWIPALIGTRPLLGPGSLARSEHVYATLDRAGIEGPLLTAAVSAVSGYVHGFVAEELAWRSRFRDPDAEAALRARVQDLLERRAADLPTLAAHVRAGDADFDAGFELGLSIVLDGIEARISGR
ncbi:TetR/AcrR family transcriptional regulator [Actinomadura livida]|uniref:AcrR family transcriptional regulator n=1 Tax=Actinomadura livida TaxID=79909 RepID=A0A7W7I868_9ACTN|nr:MULTISPECIES: TetR/AcrR family transcriptional regulator C-terminal domain-containing protein [Actinomadura]MBB4772228.1 AcrR family transcriptional regulator [Actinomadura catellatispora]GGU27799.1 TetR family transcriptional regulator [Actinomadura livida]